MIPKFEAHKLPKKHFPHCNIIKTNFVRTNDNRIVVVIHNFKTVFLQNEKYRITRRECYGKNFQNRILNRGQVEKLTSLTKRI